MALLAYSFSIHVPYAIILCIVTGLVIAVFIVIRRRR